MIRLKKKLQVIEIHCMIKMWTVYLEFWAVKLYNPRALPWILKPRLLLSGTVPYSNRSLGIGDFWDGLKHTNSVTYLIYQMIFVIFITGICLWCEITMWKQAIFICQLLKWMSRALSLHFITLNVKVPFSPTIPFHYSFSFVSLITLMLSKYIISI